MNRKHRLAFLVPTVVLLIVLVYSLTRALLILVPQQRESVAFDELKRSALAAQPQSATASAPAAAPSGQSEKEAEEAGSDWLFPYVSLAQENSDFVGWLNVADTKIDYPVMKSAEDDPAFYLHRDFYGNESFSGCLFIGGGCSANSQSFVIYGHNMDNGSMFGALDRYADYEYAASHQELTLSLPDGERVYRVFAAFQTRVYDERDDVFKYYEEVGWLGEEEYAYTVSSVRSLSLPRLPDAPTYPDQLLFLSTCSYHTDNGRFVVAAYRIK